MEHPWNGTWLDAVDPVRQCARTLPWQGQSSLMALVTTPSQTGVRWTQEAMETVEEHIKRLPALGKWFVDLGSPWVAIRDTSLFLGPLGT